MGYRFLSSRYKCSFLPSKKLNYWKRVSFPQLNYVSWINKKYSTKINCVKAFFGIKSCFYHAKIIHAMLPGQRFLVDHVNNGLDFAINPRQLHAHPQFCNHVWKSWRDIEITRMQDIFVKIFFNIYIHMKPWVSGPTYAHLN